MTAEQVALNKTSSVTDRLSAQLRRSQSNRCRVWKPSAELDNVVLILLSSADNQRECAGGQAALHASQSGCGFLCFFFLVVCRCVKIRYGVQEGVMITLKGRPLKFVF